MKVYKIELMIVNHDGLSEEDIMATLKESKYPNRCIDPRVMKIESREIGEWDDESPLNCSDRRDTEYQRLFSEDNEQ